MNVKKPILLLVVVLALVATGCPSTTDDAACADELDRDGVDLLVVTSGQAAELEKLLVGDGVACRAYPGDDLLDVNGELVRRLNDRYERPILNQEGTDRVADDRLVEILDAGFFAVPAEQVDGVLRLGVDNEIQVLPFAEASLAGHWAVLPGVGPVLDGTTDLARDWTQGTGKAFLVVDSGFTSWSAPFIAFGPPDVEDTVPSCTASVSHGTFAASIIKQAQPEARLSGIAVPPLKGGCSTSEHEGAVDKLTDDFAVALSIYFGIREANPSTVNLSIGTRAAGGTDEDPVAPYFLSRVIDFGLEREIEFFAAGGNWTGDGPVFPAAQDGVHGVGAGIEAGGDLIRWDDAHKPVADSTWPWWIEEVAVGCNLVGVGALDPTTQVVWSGSSFATPMLASGAGTDSVDVVDVGHCG